MGPGDLRGVVDEEVFEERRRERHKPVFGLHEAGDVRLVRR